MCLSKQIRKHIIIYIKITIFPHTSSDRNIFDAASNGAMAALGVIGGIAVNIVAFMSLLSFVDASLAWFGDRINVELSVEVSHVVYRKYYVGPYV